METPLLMTSRDTLRRVGRHGLKQLRRHLWPADCQSCATPLRGATPSLWVGQAGDTAYASLHHPACRAPGWGTRAMSPPGRRTVTSVARAFSAHASPTAETALDRYPGLGRLLRARDGRRCTAVVINPGLEVATLRRIDQHWALAPPAWEWAAYGLRAPLVPEPRSEHTRPGPVARRASAYLAGHTVMIECGGLAWTAALTSRSAELVVDQHGLMLVLTHAINPGERDPAPLLIVDLLASGDVALGWVTLDQTQTPSASMLETLLDA